MESSVDRLIKTWVRAPPKPSYLRGADGQAAPGRSEMSCKVELFGLPVAGFEPAAAAALHPPTTLDRRTLTIYR